MKSLVLYMSESSSPGAEFMNERKSAFEMTSRSVRAVVVTVYLTKAREGMRKGLEGVRRR